jgi:hypothetical protein
VGLLYRRGAAPPRLTEEIQHGIFRYGMIPIAFYGLLTYLWHRNLQRPDNIPDISVSPYGRSGHGPGGGAE